MILFPEMIIYMNVMGMGEKTPKREKETKLFGCPPIHLLRYGGQLFSGVWECRKQAEPTLSESGIKSNATIRKKQGRAQWGQVAWIYSDEVPISSEKVGWSKGWSIKNRDEENLGS